MFGGDEAAGGSGRKKGPPPFEIELVGRRSGGGGGQEEGEQEQGREGKGKTGVGGGPWRREPPQVEIAMGGGRQNGPSPGGVMTVSSMGQEEDEEEGQDKGKDSEGGSGGWLELFAKLWQPRRNKYSRRKTPRKKSNFSSPNLEKGGKGACSYSVTITACFV